MRMVMHRTPRVRAEKGAHHDDDAEGANDDAKMASDKQTLAESAMQKLEEFRRLRYPIGLLRGVCNFMGATTGEGTWIGVRNAIA